MLAGFIFLLAVPCYCTLSWPEIFHHKEAHVEATDSVDKKIIDAVLAEDEVNAIVLGKDSLANYARKPDCFRRVAGAIRTRCEDLEMNEDERVHAAISMTLCELATAAHHSIPLECVPFSLNSDILPSPRLQGGCVDALSRSAQFWSSYSGYLREVPQLCFAFRRWNDIDTAREIYRNATLENASLMRLLIARERATAITMRIWEARLTRLNETTSQIQATARSLSTITDQLHLRIARDVNDTLDLLHGTILNLQRQHDDRELYFLRHTEMSLAKINQNHANELNLLIPTLEQALISQLDLLLRHFHSNSQVSLGIQTQIQERWIHFKGEIDNLAELTSGIYEISSESGRAINLSLHQANTLRQSQHLATISTEHLENTISHLTSTTHAELLKINSTTASIHQTLYLQQFGNSWWLYNILTWGMEALIPADAASLSYLNIHLISRVIVTLLSFIGYFLRATLSGLMTTSIIFFSYKKPFLKFTRSLNGSEAPIQVSSQPFPCIEPPSHPALHLRGYKGSVSHAPRYQRPHVSKIPERLYRQNPF